LEQVGCHRNGQKRHGRRNVIAWYFFRGCTIELDGALEVQLANISYRLGRKLELDPATESFSHDTEANAMRTWSKYCEPYVFPNLA
jgi:hypothetical protein